MLLWGKERKIGGLPLYPQEFEDFAFCINSCDVGDLKFFGSRFTLWNGRADEECIFTRLYRVGFNQPLQDMFCNQEIKHLARTDLIMLLSYWTVGVLFETSSNLLDFLDFVLKVMIFWRWSDKVGRL